MEQSEVEAALHDAGFKTKAKVKGDRVMGIDASKNGRSFHFENLEPTKEGGAYSEAAVVSAISSTKARLP